MKKIHHIVSVFIGAVLIVSGVGKSLNVLAFQQLIHSYGLPYLDLLAPVIVLVELTLGAMLVMRHRVKTLSLLTGLLLLLFTGVYTYGYTRQGITDCGCFGAAQPWELPVWAVYVRNIVLIALANYLYFAVSADESVVWSRWRRIGLSVFLGLGLFLTGMTFRPAAFLPQSPHPLTGQAVADTPLAEYVPHEGTVWVLCYSYSCNHCLNTMENYLAMQRYERVDTALAIAVVSHDQPTDSLRLSFSRLYPQVAGLEIDQSRLPMLTHFPTSLLIEQDTIRQVWVGEMPNPYLIETNKTKQDKQ